MDFKEPMILLLKWLEEEGLNRSAVEKKLGYSENYLVQQLSKGGNRRIMRALEDLLEKARKDNAMKEVDPNAALPSGNLKVTLNDYFELMKEHAAMAKQHAEVMSRIVEAKILEPAETNSGDPQKMFQQSLEKAGARKNRLPGDQVRTSGGKSKVQDHQSGQGNIREEGK